MSQQGGRDAVAPSALETMALDIETMRVRGAAAIARHAAQALAAWEGEAEGDFVAGLAAARQRLVATRPTAVSLRNAVEFVERRALAERGEAAQRAALRRAADEFVERSGRALADIGRLGASLVKDGGTYLTHCNSQAAVGVFREAWRGGKRFRVVATETRPWRQGLLTSRQLREAGVEDVIFVVDSAVRLLLDEGLDGVVVGADTIAANGDVVNKIGTSLVALAAREHRVPFWVAAESYKVDLRATTGRDVPIEERETSEVAEAADLAEGVVVRNPVFDYTPAAWISSILSEAGMVQPADISHFARKAWS